MPSKKQQSIEDRIKSWGERTHFSFKVDPDERFMAEFCARLDGGTFQRIVTNAVTDHAKALSKRHGKNWTEYFDASFGVSMCNLFLDPEVRLSREEQSWKAFVWAHRPFFFKRADARWKPNRTAIETLWGHMDDLLDHWARTKPTDPWATGEKMRKLLGKGAPEWGPGHDVTE